MFQPAPQEAFAMPLQPMALAQADGELVDGGWEDNNDKADRARSWIPESVSVLLSEIPDYYFPAMFFTLLLYFFSTGHEMMGTLGYILLALSLFLTSQFYFMAYLRVWRILAIVFLVVTVAGVGLGISGRNVCMRSYEIYENRRSYMNVIPSENPGAKKDAGQISFRSGSRVDAGKSVGYKLGSTFCTAPIIGDAFADVAGYWAVGTDCCSQRGGFKCGDVWNKNVNGGLVVIEKGKSADADLDMYQTAAEMAAATYDLTLPDNPTFVKWSFELDDQMRLDQARLSDFTLSLSMLALVCPTVIVIILLLTGNSLLLYTRRVADPDHWHQEKVKNMDFGCECQCLTRKNYPQSLKLDLIHEQCYWSGEIYHDYVFHVANNHIFFGALLCHPAHPFSKVERLFLLVLVVAMILVPTAAVRAFFDNSASQLVRSMSAIMVMLLVTCPRNLLKMYVKKLAIADEMLELEGNAGVAVPEMYGMADSQGYSRTEAMTLWEVLFFCMAAVVVGGICVGCCFVIQAQGLDVVPALWEARDGIGYTVVLELLFHALMPRFGESSRIFLGFFGRWRAERNVRAERVKEKEAEEMRQVAVGVPPSQRRKRDIISAHLRTAKDTGKKAWHDTWALKMFNF